MIYQVHYSNKVVKYKRDGILIAKSWEAKDNGERLSWGMPYVRDCLIEGEKIMIQYNLKDQE
jgi:hypothetical protein